MSYGGHPITATNRSMNGALGNSIVNGTAMNGSMENGNVTQSNPTGLRAIDPEALKQRLYSYAPHQAPINTRALRFNRVTSTQIRKGNVPAQPRLEPVVSLLSYHFTHLVKNVTPYLIMHICSTHLYSWSLLKNIIYYSIERLMFFRYSIFFEFNPFCLNFGIHY